MDRERPVGRQMTGPSPRRGGQGGRGPLWTGPRPLVSWLIVGLLLCLPAAPAEPPPADVGARHPASVPASAQPRDSAEPAATESIDRQPYHIELHLALDPSARIDGAARAALLRQWQSLVHRFIGPPWNVSIAESPSPLASGNLEAIQARDFAKFDPAHDKIWLMRIEADDRGAALRFKGREYDVATRMLGPVQTRACLVVADVPRTLLQFSLDLFNPNAVLTGQEGGRALLRVRGASIAPASELGRVVTRGTVFLPLRLVSLKDRSVVIRRIIHTYLQVEEATGSLARCAIVSALRDPLSQRVMGPSSLAALGIKAGGSPIHLQFVARGDQAPAAGYILTARPVPEGAPFEVGMTDRAGKIVLKPGFAKGLVVLRLVAGTAEPVAEIPIMPGESTEQRKITIDPRPLTVAYQVQLDALRDQVVDLVALRARLEKRMEARLQGEDLDGLAQGLKEYALLPPRQTFADQLAKLKDQASKQQADTKAVVLSKNTQAQFNELQALIDRYLEDDAFVSYTEALERKKTERLETAKEKEKDPKNRRSPPAVQESEPAPASRVQQPVGKTPPRKGDAPRPSDVPF